MLASGILQGHPHFIHWGVIQISLANFLVIMFMIVVFVLALLLPFPGGHDDEPSPASGSPKGSAHE